MALQIAIPGPLFAILVSLQDDLAAPACQMVICRQS